MARLGQARLGQARLGRALMRLALIDPRRIARKLTQVRRAKMVKHVPNEWQLTLGVLRMWHRVLFRSDTIGTCSNNAVRNNWRARLLLLRPLRFPFLLAEQALTPWDFSGLFSSPERIIRHLLAAHHDGFQFVYDLQILSIYPGALADLHERVKAVIARDNARTRWLRDLTVFERYHENLLTAVENALTDRNQLDPQTEADPDITFTGYLSWCAAQPATPAASWKQFLHGNLALSSTPTADDVPRNAAPS